jgi:hypothetical protein
MDGIRSNVDQQLAMHDPTGDGSRIPFRALLTNSPFSLNLFQTFLVATLRAFRLVVPCQTAADVTATLVEIWRALFSLSVADSAPTVRPICIG